MESLPGSCTLSSTKSGTCLAAGWLGALLSLVAAAASAAESNAPQSLNFSKVGVGSGLEANVVNELLVDRHGFLWIGSREGLFRFDGQRVTDFKPEPDHPGSITAPDIRTLYEARDGTLWIGNNAGGLNRFDPETETFDNWRHDPADAGSLSSDNVFAIEEDAAGSLWVATRQGLNRMQPDGRFERVGGLSHNWAFALEADAHGRLWVGTVGGGIDILDTTTSQITRRDLANQFGGAIGFNDVFVLHRDERDRMWVGTRGGLVLVAPDGRAPMRIPVTPSDVDPETVIAIRKGPDGNMWVLLLEQGLVSVNPDTLALRHIDATSDGGVGFPETAILSFEFSAGEQVIVGTWGNGVYSASANAPPFRLVAGGEGESIRNPNVTAIVADSEAVAWVGTFGGGPQRLDAETFQPLPPTSPDRRLEEYAVTAMAADASGTIYVGSTTGMWVFETDGASAFLAPGPVGSGRFAEGYINAVLTDSDGALWVGLGGNGLARRAPGDDVFQSLRHDTGNAASLSGDYITTLLDLGDSHLLVGTRSNGLNRCRKQPWACRHYQAGPGKPLGHFNVTSLLAQDDGVFWVGTDGGGLHRLQLDANGEVLGAKRWTERDGLVNDGVMAIVRDDTALWIATRNGLSRFDTDREVFNGYVESTGLPASAFNAGAVASAAGNLLFGTKRGLLVLPRGWRAADMVAPTLRFTRIEVLGDARRTERAPWLRDPVEVPYGAVIALEFSVLDFQGVPKRYEYRSAGETRWLDLGASSDLTLAGLDPGDHEVEVRAQLATGAWSPAETLRMNVSTPFWLHPAFRVLVVLLLAGLLLAFHRYRTTALRRRNIELYALQRQRGEALALAGERKSHLESALAGLSALTRELEKAKEEERRRISANLHDELGQTLTAAKINLQLAAGNPDTDVREKRIDAALGMLNGMIDQVRNIALMLRPPLLDEAGLVDAVRSHLERVGEQAGIDIAFEAQAGVGDVDPEGRTILFRVIQESVNNAVRHSGAAHIAVDLERDSDDVVARIADDGNGFDIAATREKIERGEHLGLLGMSERLRAAGGRLDIQSDVTGGTTITARLPG